MHFDFAHPSHTMKSQAASSCCWLLFFLFPIAAKETLETPSFQSGILYQYRYTLDGHINYLSRLPLGGSKFKAEASVDVHLLWRNPTEPTQQFLQIQIHDLQGHSDMEEKKSQNIDENQSVKLSLSARDVEQPIFLHWNKGKIEGIYGEKTGNALTLELKRGLISLFQLQAHSGTVTEEDISGSCQVTYTVSKNSALKTKDLHSCVRPKFGFSAVNKIFGVLWQPTSTIHYALEGNLIKSILSEENHIISLTLKSSTGVNIASRQHLEFVTQVPGPKELSGKTLEDVLAAVLQKPQPINIASDPAKRICTQCPTLRTYLKTHAKKKLKINLSRASTTWHFCKVVQMLRDAKKKDILLLLKGAPESMIPFYVEAAVAAQSTACLTALSEFLDFGNKTQAPLIEKFLYAAALSPRPSKELLHLVLDKLNEKKLDSAIWETGNLVSGSLLGKLCRQKLCELQVKMAMKHIFHQTRRQYQKTSRLAAAEILLENNPSPMDFINVVLATRELEPEMSRFLLSKIQGIVHSRHHPTRQLIKDVLKDPQINNYFFLSSEAGSSISFSGPLAVTSDSLSTFGLELLFSDVGILRKSTTSFNILSHGHQLQAAQVAIEAKGFEGFMGGNPGDEEEDFMAGMSAVLLDVQLRPVAFFEGYADLMSKVLMSSLEPTSVIKGNVLLMDHQQAIPLQSGFQTIITLQGGLGLDVSADINMNLWEQEFKTGIKTRGALTIDFQAELDTPFYQATVKSQTEAEMATSFNTVAKFFDSPVLMCLQLTEDQVSYREIFTVSESSTNHSLTIQKGKRATIPGRELPLHKANSAMCKILLAQTVGQ
nr:microsomal triglyceride transfer protein large subunit-like [Pogona vitticeps]